MNEQTPQRPTPQQLYAADVSNSLMQRGVNTRGEKIKKWLDPSDPFRIKLMDFYYYRIKFREEEIPLTKDDVEAFYSDLRSKYSEFQHKPCHCEANAEAISTITRGWRVGSLSSFLANWRTNEHRSHRG